MKRFIGIILFVLVTSTASAQLFGFSAYGNSYGYSGGSSDGGLSSGYRGMVEVGDGFDFCCMGNVFKFSTTHGYQFNPYLYLGGFVSLGTAQSYGGYYSCCETSFNLRFGADFRTYMSKRRFAPFVGVKFGLDLSDDGPFVHLSAQAGFRVAIKNRHGVNFAVQFGPAQYFESAEMLFKLGYEF